MIGLNRRSKGAVSARSLAYASSPLLASKTPPWRSRVLVVMVALGFLVLLGRAVYVQIVATDFYLAQGERRFVHTYDVPASRGRIVDRNGLILATSVVTSTVYANRQNFKATPAQKKDLLRLLGMTAAEFDERMAQDLTDVLIKRQVPDAQWRQARALGIKGLRATPGYTRNYPEGEAAAHVVGFTDQKEQGREGVELAFQKDLEGRDGQRGIVRDGVGRVVDDYVDAIDPMPGREVQLSLDTKVQFFAYQRVRDAVAMHKAKAGSVVVIDVVSGEILALANFPSFHPSMRTKLNQDEFGEAARNRALTDVFEPGSVMKPFVAAWALETGRVQPGTVLSTGAFSVGGRPIHDTHPREQMTVTEIVQRSSNIGAAKLAMQFEPRELWELYSNVGFGQRPQIEFPGARSGVLRPYRSWKPVDQSRLAFGYGLSASLLQMARAYTVFARDGELVPITMLKQDQPAAGVRVLSPEVAREMRKMLQLATETGGTATRAQAMGYSVGGKTGTAHAYDGGEYASNKHRAWFVGMAPMGNPRIVVAVMVDQPTQGGHFGGDVAAPVFSQVVQQTLRLLNVPPDIEVRRQITAQAVAQAAAPAPPGTR
ncbi:MAG TPA: penicillin-binding protein 2 [Burkholderiaceae bacterium]|nr:penicillin-binding protein 2 [Burkholderiaceae bacterium]